MNRKEAVAIALELYARGYTETRGEALNLARNHPDKAQEILVLYRRGDEMGHADDVARIHGDDGYGHANTGQAP